MAKKRLGKGLDALLGSEDFDTKDEIGKLIEVNVNIIKPNPYQPRMEVEKSNINELKESIKEKGIIQPVVLRKVNKTFELIAGERRFVAAKELGMDKIPAIVLDIKSKEEMLELSIIENIHRENLNPIEIATGYKRLIDECNLKQDEVAAKVGIDRSTVTNFLRLLKLPDKIKNGIKENKITAGHARALLSVDGDDAKIKLYEKILKDNLSVRNVESLISRKRPVKKTKAKKETNNVYAPLEGKLREIFGTKVKIKGKKEGGNIEIEFYSTEDLERLIEMFETISKNY